jgi:hypothetical protein
MCYIKLYRLYTFRNSFQTAKFDCFNLFINLKSHKCDLSRCNEASTFGHCNARDIIVVANEEILMPRLQVLNDQVASDRIDHMHSIWMYFEPIGKLA